MIKEGFSKIKNAKLLKGKEETKALESGERNTKQDAKDKTIALFGCGDQSMSDTFCNAVGTIYHRLQKTGATFYGAFEAGDYTFDKSTAFINGKFIGLLIDDVNEPEKTENRLNHWVELLQSEYIVTQ